MKKAAKGELMGVDDVLAFVTDNKSIVEVPGWGKKIEVKRMTLAQMIALKDIPDGEQESTMLKYALGMTDNQVKRLKSENDGIKFAQLMGAIKAAYTVSDETVKK
jgi:DNA-binding Xre family transcriptional regulator